MGKEVARLIRPLLEMYQLWKAKPPAVQRIERQDVPEEYRSLLVNDEDLADRLRANYQREVSLRMLKRQVAGPAFLRHYTLMMADCDLPLAMGICKIDMSMVSVAYQPQLLKSTKPLSLFLDEIGVATHNCPKAFFRIRSDPLLAKALNLTQDALLYGRCGFVYDQTWHIVADKVEILPPLPDPEDYA